MNLTTIWQMNFIKLHIFGKFEVMKRRDLIKTSIALGLGGITSIKDLDSMVKTIENQYNSKYKKNKNIVIILLGGGVRFEDSAVALERETNTWMPNLFPGEMASHPSIKAIPSISKAPLTSTLSNFYNISDAPNQHNQALSQILGTSSNVSLASARLLIEKESPLLAAIQSLQKKNKNLFYLHDIPNTENLIDSKDLEIKSAINATVKEVYTSSEKSLSGNQTQLFEKALDVIHSNSPRITIIHPRMLDCAHSNSTKYYQSLNQLDYSIAWLMAQLKQLNIKHFMETNWFILPEIGRNSQGNSIVDKNKLPGYDHHHPSAKRSWMIEYNVKNIVAKKSELSHNQLHNTIFNSISL